MATAKITRNIQDSKKFKRIYRFELFTSSNAVAKYAFNFITGPSRYTLEEKNRIAIQKTFGGTYVDDFGEDNKKISLSGSFGLNQYSVGWDDKRASQVVGAFAALKYFKDKFVRYHEWAKKNGKPLPVYIKFYDLSTEIESHSQGWYVIIDDFRTERDAASGYIYNWTMELTVLGRGYYEFKKEYGIMKGVVKSHLKGRGPLGFITNFASLGGRLASLFGKESPTTTTTLYTFEEEGLTGALGAFGNFLNAAQGAIENIIDFSDTLLKFADEVVLAVDGAVEFGKDIVAIANTAVALVNSWVQAPANLLDSVSNSISQVNSLVQDCRNVAEKFSDIFYTHGDETLLAQWKRCTEGIEGECNKLKALSVKPLDGFDNYRSVGLREDARLEGERLAAIAAGLPPGSKLPTTMVDPTKTIVKYQKSIMPLSMSAADIAKEIYGNASLAHLIIDANPGVDFQNRTVTDIRVPQFYTRDEMAQLVTAPIFDSNPNGKDIYVDENGNMTLGSRGDIAIITDGANPIQQLTRQIETEVGNLGSDPNYGLEYAVGETDVEVAAILMANRIQAIVSADKRFGDESRVTGVIIGTDGIEVQMMIQVGAAEPVTVTKYIKRNR